jgi:hypothetical protein
MGHPLFVLSGIGGEQPQSYMTHGVTQGHENRVSDLRRRRTRICGAVEPALQSVLDIAA